MRMSREPWSATTPSTAAMHASASAMSNVNGVALPPAVDRSFAVVAAASASMSAMTTVAPRSAKWRAYSAPMPWPAPVTTATRPLKSDMTIPLVDEHRSGRISKGILASGDVPAGRTMTSTSTEALSAKDIRERLGHQLIDGDGHLIEVREAFVRFVDQRNQGGLFDDPSARALLVPGEELKLIPPLEERRRLHIRTNARWFTTADTHDYAAVTMPGLMHERLPDTGFD